MATLWQQPLMDAPPRSRIQLVVADFDHSRRDAIVHELDSHLLFEVIAQLRTVEEFHRVLADDTPELVLCPAAFLPNTKEDEVFPLFITIGRDAAVGDICARVVASVDEPIVARIDAALTVAASRILTIKAGELSSLIRKYMQHGQELPERVRSIAVSCEGTECLLDISQIRWIKAAGNYVCLYTDAGTYELRESIRRAHTRLGSSGFVRIHRGTVVNAMAIHHQVVHNGVPCELVLSDGTRLQVGPNFRDQVPADIPVLPTNVVS